MGPESHRPWRFRRCWRCRTVERASAFRVLGTYRPGWTAAGDLERTCPNCGARGETRDFPVVRERHP
jgi:hypothetical protein